REASSRSARPPGVAASTASITSSPGDSAASRAAATARGSLRCCRASSRYSASLAAPVGAALAYEILGCGEHRCEYATGTPARRPLERPGDVAVRGEPQRPTLGVPHADPLDHRCLPARGLVPGDDGLLRPG